MNHSFPIRKECPPGACICERERLLEDPQSDCRVLQLTREEEQRLLGRLENIASYAELERMCQRMQEMLGIVIRIAPGANEIRTVRGLVITVVEQPGLCRKTRQSIPTALRRCLERNPQIIYELLNTHDLLKDA